MSNSIDQSGLQVNSLTEIRTNLENSFKAIYGQNINIDQNTPDGQLINIIAQMLADYGELLLDINAGFDPDQAVGVILDQRVKLNGITRKQGSFTTCDVQVTFNNSGVIKGLDSYSEDDCFQVSDSTGNILIPFNTTTGVDGEAKTVAFRAKEYGPLNFAVGSITTIVTPEFGVESVNNTTIQTTTGENEESDASLRLRRELAAKRFSLYGGIETLEDSLKSITGVTFVRVKENTTDSVDGFGIPPHGIWIIIDGSYSDSEVGNTIYQKRIAGTPMKGEEESSGEEYGKTYDITTPHGEIFTAKWSIPVPVTAYIKVTCIIYGETFSEIPVINAIIGNIHPKVGERLDSTQIADVLSRNVDGIIINEIKVSEDGLTWVDYIEPALNEKYTIDSSNITVLETE